METVKYIAGLLTTVYVLSGILLFVFQRNFLYFPSGAFEHPYAVEAFSSAGERIEVVVLNDGQENALLYFGGNAEAVVHNAPGFIEAFPHHTVYLVNYRAYGGSSGRPSEAALNIDAQTIYDSVVTRHASVTVVGRSLGSGIATFLAATRAIDKMVLITPYDSIQRLAQDRFPIYPMSILLRDTYNSVGRIEDIASTTLIILAQHDEVIPYDSSARLIEAFPPDQVTVKTIAGAGHNTVSDAAEYFVYLRQFLRSGSNTRGSKPARMRID